MSRKSFISIIAFVLLCDITASAYEGQDLVGECYIPVIDGIIGFEDYAILADNWLEYQLWP